MSREKIAWSEGFDRPGRELLDSLISKGFDPLATRRVVAVFGESGSGKTICALSLQRAMEAIGWKTAVLHMDGYFHLPPRQNHYARLKNPERVGPGEVDLERLQGHLDAFHAGAAYLTVPYTDYPGDRLVNEILDLSGVQVLLAEGTYLGMIQQADCRIYLNADYRQTWDNRKKRGRDQMDPFIEQVLAREHEWVLASAGQPDFLLDAHYRLHPHPFAP